MDAEPFPLCKDDVVNEFFELARDRIEHELFVQNAYRNEEFVCKLIKCIALVVLHVRRSFSRRDGMILCRSFLLTQASPNAKTQVRMSGFIEILTVLLNTPHASRQQCLVISLFCKTAAEDEVNHDWVSVAGLRLLVLVVCSPPSSPALHCSKCAQYSACLRAHCYSMRRRIPMP